VALWAIDGAEGGGIFCCPCVNGTASLRIPPWPRMAKAKDLGKNVKINDLRRGVMANKPNGNYSSYANDCGTVITWIL
jgi:hypothetical protein